MTDHEKYRILWNRIEKQAFSPSGDKKDKDQQKWLQNCVKHFLFILETDSNKIYRMLRALKKRNKNNPFEIKISIPEWPIQCTIELGDSNPQKFSYSLNWTNEPNAGTKKTIRFDYDNEHDYWRHDSKPTTNSELPQLKQNLKGKNSQEQKNLHRWEHNCSTEDIEKIFNSRILHPPLHLHPEFRDDIRIGLNETNPFVFLYQLLFQLLVLVGEEKRSNELKRMAGLLYEKWEKFDLPSSELFPES